MKDLQAIQGHIQDSPEQISQDSLGCHQIRPLSWVGSSPSSRLWGHFHTFLSRYDGPLLGGLCGRGGGHYAWLVGQENYPLSAADQRRP